LHIDPKLDKLQQLIESKRALQPALITTGRIRNTVGRPGNPKFAAAAERARQALNGKTQINGTQSTRIQNIDNRIVATKEVKESSNISKRSNALLTTPLAHRTINMNDTGVVKNAGAKHLGNYLDKYA